ncbi:MmcQ/YjbR family DNA-binding protein [Nocardioides caldifontis]|uniref:MmcQ/YjbR family DNA-binding protein n=1 Tax=Nocardioides caldifontis TaxID=2588938 RepID=UPI0011DFB129|nr:MmcQ/YjbR family DNA-binding protein [Nocardioides caldifontis]
MATEDDVRRLCLAMPDVTERPSWGQPTWFRGTGKRGKLFARMWEDGVLTVKTEERDVLAGSQPDTFYWTPHHDRSPLLVLARLDRIGETELVELLEDSYRLAG